MKTTRTLFISMFALLTATTAQADVEIDETTFPDEHFRSWVLANPFGQDGVLTDEEIAGVTKIVVNTKKIQSLKGIEYFTELTWLDCINNQLTELDVSKCSKLTYLSCPWNQLTELDVSENTALTTLSCQANQLTSLDVSKNASLAELYCNANKLTSLNVSENTALTRLTCMGNQLTALDVSKNIALVDLNCSNNQLTSINVLGCTVLESLECSGNKLTTLDVSDCANLWQLFCYSNQIKGGKMDALLESLPTPKNSVGHLFVINDRDEENVMTKAQVAEAKAKGWMPQYNDPDTYGWVEYEGSEGVTGIVSPFSETEKVAVYDLQGRQLPGKPARGIYIEGGKKVIK